MVDVYCGNKFMKGGGWEGDGRQAGRVISWQALGLDGRLGRPTTTSLFPLENVFSLKFTML